MGQLTGFARAFALAMIAAWCFSAHTDTALAAEKKQKPAAAPAAPAKPLTDAEEKKKNAEASRRNYESGVKAYQAGKLQPAVDDLSAALRGGGLQSQDMAHAMYVRGLAYKKQSKPGLAISDLTSALWLKNGLSDADRQSATAERAEAYRLAGLGDGNSGTEKVAVADPNVVANPAPAAAAAAPTPAPPVPAANAASKAKPEKPSKSAKKTKDAVKVAAAAPEPAPVQSEVTRQAPDSEAAKDAAAARALARQQNDETSLQAVASGRTVGAANTVGASAVAAASQVATLAPADVPAPIPAAVAAAEKAAATAPAAAAPAQAAAAATKSEAATPVLAAAPTTDAVTGVVQGPAPVAPKNTVVGFFSNLFGSSSSAKSAEPAPQATAPVTADAAPATASTPAAKPPVTTAAITPAAKVSPVKAGKYKLHIAALRSRTEAEAMAQQISTQHGDALNNHVAQVDEAVIGSMGTFYRVRVPGYAEPNEPRTVCNKLRTSGLDCLVVTN